MSIENITAGDDKILKRTFLEDGAAFNIAGDKFFWTVKTNVELPDNQATYQVIQVIPASADAAAGVHRVQMPNNLTVGTYYYDIQIRRDASAGGGVHTVDQGSFDVTQQVTIASS